MAAAALLRGEILAPPAGRRVGALVTLSAQATFGAPGRPLGWGPTGCAVAPASSGAVLVVGHATRPCLSVPQECGAGAVLGAVAVASAGRGVWPGRVPARFALASVWHARGAGPTPERGPLGGSRGGGTGWGAGWKLVW
jgi:hypothetical protein